MARVYDDLQNATAETGYTGEVRRWCLLVCVVAGCGRFAFEEHGGASNPDATSDAAGDAAGELYARTVSDDLPIAYWRFESAGTVIDETGRGHDGTLTGGVAMGAGIVGKGAVMSAGGATQNDGGHLLVPSADFLFDGNAPFTLECWVLPTRIAGNWTQVFETDNFDAMARRNGYTIEYLDDHVHVIRRRDGVEQEAMATNVMVTGRWIHVAGTYDGAQLRMYVDGMLRDTQASPLAMLSAASTTFSVSDDRYALTGTLDECAIYDRALPDDRIAAHYATGLGI